MKELTIEARIENIEAVTDFVEEWLDALQCPLNAKLRIKIAIDELFGNIARYAYAPNTGDATVRVEAAEEPRGATITFFDNGIPYNPLQGDDPDISLPAEEREIGGLGLYLVKRTMDAVTYAYRDGQNVLSIRKNF